MAKSNYHWWIRRVFPDITNVKFRGVWNYREILMTLMLYWSGLEVFPPNNIVHLHLAGNKYQRKI